MLHLIAAVAEPWLFTKRILHPRHPIEHDFAILVVKNVCDKVPMPLKLEARTGRHLGQ
jgi:hypothetical protein